VSCRRQSKTWSFSSYHWRGIPFFSLLPCRRNFPPFFFFRGGRSLPFLFPPSFFLATRRTTPPLGYASSSHVYGCAPILLVKSRLLLFSTSYPFFSPFLYELMECRFFFFFDAFFSPPPPLVRKTLFFFLFFDASRIRFSFPSPFPPRLRCWGTISFFSPRFPLDSEFMALQASFLPFFFLPPSVLPMCGSRDCFFSSLLSFFIVNDRAAFSLPAAAFSLSRNKASRAFFLLPTNCRFLIFFSLSQLFPFLSAEDRQQLISLPPSWRTHKASLFFKPFFSFLFLFPYRTRAPLLLRLARVPPFPPVFLILIRARHFPPGNVLSFLFPFLFFFLRDCSITTPGHALFSLGHGRGNAFPSLFSVFFPFTRRIRLFFPFPFLRHGMYHPEMFFSLFFFLWGVSLSLIESMVFVFSFFFFLPPPFLQGLSFP